MYIYIYITAVGVCLNWIDNIQNTTATQTGTFKYKRMCKVSLWLLRQRNPKLERATNRSDMYMSMCVYIYIYQHVLFLYMYIYSYIYILQGLGWA